jgi:hypothetical protein
MGLHENLLRGIYAYGEPHQAAAAGSAGMWGIRSLCRSC